jgi:ADP-ribose 1''-phosphate phosphatase
MATIVNVKGSLFDAPKGSILVHACNARGVWGTGIAVEFKKRFPESFDFYHELCMEEGNKLLGITILCPEENGYVVGCLISSDGYGKFKDSPEDILKNTRLALPCVLAENRPIHSNMFNSGLFAVPWADTEKVLLETMDKVGYTDPWTVWQI